MEARGDVDTARQWADLKQFTHDGIATGGAQV